MKHVWITGGAGFIGSHLCDAFLRRGYAVTAVDNFATGRETNLRDALKHPYFQFLEANVSRPVDRSSSKFLREYGLHGVLHFACPASPVDFSRIPFEILEVDSLGTMHSVDLAMAYGARYILASTSEIYGDPLVHPQGEHYWGNVSTLGPRACYDEAKRFAEAYVGTAMRHLHLNAAIARIFNTYGPRMRPDDGRVIPEFAAQALSGGEIPVCGDGLQTRSLCYVTDLVEAVVKLFESDVKEPVNLGNPDERSVLEMARIVKDMAHSESPIVHIEARPEDPRRRCPDIGKAKALLGWAPRVPLQEGLAATLRYFRAQLELRREAA